MLHLTMPVSSTSQWSPPRGTALPSYPLKPPWKEQPLGCACSCCLDQTSTSSLPLHHPIAYKHLSSTSLALT